MWQIAHSTSSSLHFAARGMDEYHCKSNWLVEGNGDLHLHRYLWTRSMATSLLSWPLQLEHQSTHRLWLYAHTISIYRENETENVCVLHFAAAISMPTPSRNSWLRVALGLRNLPTLTEWLHAHIVSSIAPAFSLPILRAENWLIGNNLCEILNDGDHSNLQGPGKSSSDTLLCRACDWCLCSIVAFVCFKTQPVKTSVMPVSRPNERTKGSWSIEAEDKEVDRWFIIILQQSGDRSI